MIQEIRKVATHFSEEIKKKTHHLDEVRIAGVIKKIIPPVFEKENHLSSSYMLELDDGVGSIYVYVSQAAKGYYDFIQEGAFVSFKGYVNVIYRKINDEIVKDYSVVAYESEKMQVGEGNEELFSLS